MRRKRGRVSATLNRNLIRHLPLAEATALPSNGFWEVYVDRWWAHEPGKGLLFYGKSPQCNPHESIARNVQEKCHPDAELLFVERVYVRHDCGDYL
jgi:hypothetical protein